MVPVIIHSLCVLDIIYHISLIGEQYPFRVALSRSRIGTLTVLRLFFSYDKLPTCAFNSSQYDERMRFDC